MREMPFFFSVLSHRDTDILDHLMLGMSRFLQLWAGHISQLTLYVCMPN